MPVDSTTEEARSVANRAIELERNKRFFEAFRAYVSATQLFLEAARASPETLGSDAPSDVYKRQPHGVAMLGTC